MSVRTGTRTAGEHLGDWLSAHTGVPGPWELERLTGGNSNETCLLRGAGQPGYILRRPPAKALSSSAHSVAREYRLLTALHGTGVPVPRPVGLCEDEAVPLAPFLVMQHVSGGVSVTDELPAAYRADPDALSTIAGQLVDTLAAVHLVDWRAAGLADFGRPDGFLDRQVRRWSGQWERIARRPLPEMVRLAGWLERNKPAGSPPALLHGDFHLDNCLVSETSPTLLAVIDWEMATIGDPLLDLGLLLAFWGERPVTHCAMPAIQAVSRLPGAPSKEWMLARYETAIGARVPRIDYYQCLAWFKLAAIVEASYSQYLAGQLDTEYAAALGHDVPAMLAEASMIAGLRS